MLLTISGKLTVKKACKDIKIFNFWLQVINKLEISWSKILQV